MDSLPDTPSGLLRLALADLERVEADRRYRVNMRTWHAYRYRGGRCEVCLAGAVMAGSLGIGPERDCSPARLGVPLMHKMQAIDLMRRGQLREAAREMGLVPPATLRNRPRTEYGDSPEEFKADMRAAAGALEEAGL